VPFSGLIGPSLADFDSTGILGCEGFDSFGGKGGGPVKKETII